MSLSSAINTAQSSLSNTSKQTSILSKNLSNASNPDYARRAGVLSSMLPGSQVIRVDRAQNDALLKQLLGGIAATNGQEALLNGVDDLKSIMGGNDYETSPANLIATLRDQLQIYATKSNDLTAAESSIAAAGDVANGLNTASDAVQKIRTQADADIAAGVEDLNSLLAKFETANNAVIRGTRAGTDTSDDLDERQKLLTQISAYVGVNVVERDDNDLVLYTKSGTVLFETTARAVTFTQTNAFDATTTGGQVFIDGLPLDPGTGADTTASGSLAGLLQLRDDVAPAFQSQLDEIARGLITVFAESDQSGGGGPDLAGLFTTAAGTVPTAGTVVPGLAKSIRVNPALVSSAGGDPNLLRDGGINGANYVVNPIPGDTGYSVRLDALVTGLEAPLAFDGTALAGTQGSVLSYAAGSVGWLETIRSSASRASETKSAAQTRTQDAFSNDTGVNIDEEMSLMLELEQSYKASAKLISTIDEMLQSLLDSVR